MKSVTISIPEGKIPQWVNGVLTLVDETPAKDNRPVTERIKTFEDACKALGDDSQEVCDYHYIIDSNCASEDVIAYAKLRIIVAALNEGWKPEFKAGEWRYYPWYDLYTKEEWDQLDETKKRERGVCFGGRAARGAHGGFVCVRSIYAPSYSNADFGSHLCFKSSDLAIYAGKQFAAIWLDFCYLPNAISNNKE